MSLVPGEDDEVAEPDEVGEGGYGWSGRVTHVACRELSGGEHQ